MWRKVVGMKKVGGTRRWVVKLFEGRVCRVFGGHRTGGSRRAATGWENFEKIVSYLGALERVISDASILCSIPKMPCS